MRKLLVWTPVLALALLAGCSGSGGNGGGGGGNPAGNGAPAATSTGTGGGAGTNDACSRGVKPTDPGVADVYCAGTAEVRIQVDSVSKDLRGGTCHNVPGQIWSVAVGVIVDITGQHGKYAGPQVDIVAISGNGTGATVQATLDGKMVLSNDDAKFTLSSDGKTAHIDGTGDHNSDTPNAKITVDVAC